MVIGVEGNLHGGQGAIDFEYGAAARLGFKFPSGGIVYVRGGYQWVQRNPRYGVPDYANWSVTLAREIYYGFTLTVGYYDTDIRKSQCGGGLKVCDARAVVSISRTF